MRDADFLDVFIQRKADDALVRCLLSTLQRAKVSGESIGIGGLVSALLQTSEAEIIFPKSTLAKMQKQISQEQLPQRLADPKDLIKLLDHAFKVADRLQLAKVNLPSLLGCAVSLPTQNSGSLSRLQEILRDNGIMVLGPADTPKATDFKYEALDYGYDLTRKMGSVIESPLIGREAELQRLMWTLLANRNPILTGHPGVGKSALVEGFAWLLAHPTGSVPEELWNLRVISVQVSDLVAGSAVRGSLEKRMNDFIEHLAATPNLVAFVDEIHSLLAGSNDSGQVIVDTIKPGLARGTVRLIGATTEQEYQRYFATDRALRERFRDIRLNEPTRDEAMGILGGRGSNLLSPAVRNRGVDLGQDAVASSVDLSLAHFRDYGFPRKPIELLQEAGARKAYELSTGGEGHPVSPLVTADDVAAVAADELGLAKEALRGGAHDRIRSLQQALAHDVVGQVEALDSIVQCLCSAYSGFADPSRPLSVLLFHGPHGTGKTTACRAIAWSVYGSAQALYTLDMLDYQDQHAVNKLAGSAPGYRNSGESWTVFAAVRSRPSTVVVLDRVESLSEHLRPVVGNFLSGYATDGLGYATDFSKCIFVLVAGPSLSAQLGRCADLGERDQCLDRYLGTQIRSTINRSIEFSPLTREQLRSILKVRIDTKRRQVDPGDPTCQQVLERLGENGVGEAILDEAIRLGGNGNALESALDSATQGLVWETLQFQ